MAKSDWSKNEEAILKFWQDNQIFTKSLAQPAPSGEFIFYEGPPTANGRPGIHHLEARAFKDALPRYKTMRGYHVRRKAGWDTHGLPVELEVEKELGYKSKKDILEHGTIAEFNKKCRESVWKYLDEWEKFTNRMGYWVDQEHPYITYEPSYMESVWWIVKQIHERGLLYKDYKVLPWCPRCGTALSSHELAQGYKTVKDLAVTVKFKVKDPAVHNLPENTYLLAWTTTPWTLPGNVALAVGEDIDYALLKNLENGDSYVVSDSLVSKLISDKLAITPWSGKHVTKKGKELVGLKYESLYPFSPRNEQSHQVYPADFVTTVDGTGIVHTAVMYGQDDFELGTKFNLPKHHLVAEDGTFLPAVTSWAGRFVKDEELAVDIIKDLAKRNALFAKAKYEHSYPFCWRCKTPLIYYARTSWYIKMSALRDELIKENQQINWQPPHLRDGRFGEWLKEVKDWAVSRERYWGTPLPVWHTESGEQVVIGSIDELKKYTKKSGNKYFVMRHGEGEHQIASVYTGAHDQKYHLTEKGKAEVLAKVAELKKLGITKIYTSPVVRCQETAALLSKELNLSPITDDRLHELDFGDFADKSTKGFDHWFDENKATFTTKIAGGESLLDAKKRFGDFCYDIDTQQQNETILVVTHSIGFEAFTQVVEGADEKRSFQIASELKITPAEIREFDFTPLPHNENYELDLHRPYIDKIELQTAAGEKLTRTPELLDVWFDSGAMPLAQDHYPFENKDWIDKGGYPADFIAEAIDQTRGWFYTLHAIGILLGRGKAYKNVISVGHILDSQGRKMSKSLGNGVDPWELFEQHGADPLRFWMYTVNSPGESKNFAEELVVEVTRKVFNPLLNVLNFYELYGNKAVPANPEWASEHVLDRWIMARLNECTKLVTESLDQFLITEPARALRDFILDFSQWYLRRSRERFKSDSVIERQAAAATTYIVLKQLAQLLAPLTPFLAEFVYQKLRQEVDPISVHLTTWPAANKIDEKLIVEMQATRELVTLALEARNKAGIKVRQPLAKLTITTEISAELQEIIKDEVNIKQVLVDASLAGGVILDTAITPELREEGEMRELIRQIQDWRKEAGLQPNQQVVVKITVPEAGKNILTKYQADIAQATSVTIQAIQVGESFAAELAA
jgi:isoleucyl-tRNA synthetase